MKLKLVDLDPHFVKGVAPLHYEHSDDIQAAEGLQLQCPACHWADRRIGGDNLSHTITVWRDPGAWDFAGHGYGDLSLVSGRTMVELLTAGACHAQFYVKDGRVDFC